MTKPIRVTIRGPDDPRVDAPTVDDLLGQIRDFVGILRDVERAVEADGANELVWRVTDATMNSPISLELTPYGDRAAGEISARAALVEGVVVEGLRALRSGEARPPYFTDETIAKAQRIHGRVLNGLSDTVFTFENEGEGIVINPAAARGFQKTMESAQARAAMPYREFGSIEGFVTKPELDGHNRAILRFKARLGGAEIKAFASGHAFRQVEELTLHEVWQGVRVRVYGTINYRTLGQIEHINATGIEILDKHNLPGIDDILDTGFTSGLSTEHFLRELRRDD
jgi:hypothetical protein